MVRAPQTSVNVDTLRSLLGTAAPPRPPPPPQDETLVEPQHVNEETRARETNELASAAADLRLQASSSASTSQRDVRVSSGPPQHNNRRGFSPTVRVKVVYVRGGGHELCACVRAMDSSRGAHTETFLQTLTSHLTRVSSIVLWDAISSLVPRETGLGGSLSAAAGLSLCPALTHRVVWQTTDDYGDGGAFPELHVLQYPLDMALGLAGPGGASPPVEGVTRRGGAGGLVRAC
jgi:hypothetical protein